MKILPKSFIKKFNGKIVNIHPSLLPKYKGLNTHFKAIQNKDKVAGCTVHFVTAKLDSGKIILQKKVKISKKDTSSMIRIDAFVDEEFLNTYWADGLIIATPTGSTGYSLSCNGPVILPASKSLVITPIAPHNLNARPMVIPDDTNIELEVDAREKKFLISLDSRIATVPIGTKIFIAKAPFTIKSMLPNNQSFLQTLRSKLLWGEDIRNESPFSIKSNNK